MRRVLSMLILSVLMIGCRNGRDIGPLYGQWVIEEMTVDGQPTDVDLSVYNWRFQQDIVMITSTFPIMEFDQCVGTWTLDDSVLTLRFDHHSEGLNPEVGYTPPTQLMLSRGVTIAHINALTSKNMVMSFIDAQGQTVLYRMTKLN